MPGAPSPGMIGHIVNRIRQEQREERLGEFFEFCDAQVARIRHSLTPAPLAPLPPLKRGPYNRAELPADTYTLTVR